MSRYELMPGTTYHDLVVEVGFAERLDAAKTIPLLRLICNEIEGAIAQSLELFIQGISLIHCEEKTLQLVLRLTPTENTPGLDHDDCLHRRTHFVWYLFARVDMLQPLNDVPFPNDFRSWLDIVDEYGLNDS